MKKLAALLGTIILGISVSTMHADGFGLPVSATLTLPHLSDTNWFNGEFGFVPAGYGNFATHEAIAIGNGTEFGFANGVDLITANFTADTFTLTDSCVVAGCVNSPFQVTFANPGILGYNARYVNFSGGVLFNDVSDFGSESKVLVIRSLGNPDGSGGTLKFGYSAVPEPGTFGLMATGILGAAGAVRRCYLA
jgi:hypothetical protein